MIRSTLSIVPALIRFRATRIRLAAVRELSDIGMPPPPPDSFTIARLRLAWQWSLLLDAISGRPYDGPTPRGLE